MPKFKPRIFQTALKPVESRRFLLVAVTTAALLVGSAGAVGVWRVFFDFSLGYQVLYRHQLRKIADVHGVDTVFLGDSSLGNALDAAEFSRLTGMNAVNLALTGSYGYEGSYNLIKRLAGRPVKNVVVMCTLDMMQREVSYTGYLLTINGLGDVIELSGAERIELLSAFFDQIFSFEQILIALRNLIGFGRQNIFIEDDYIQQGSPMEKAHLKQMLKSKIKPEKVRFLVRLRDYCAARNLNLIYIHGPIHEDAGRASADYAAEVNRLLINAGIEIVPELTLIPCEEVGDSPDHVAKQFKEKFTMHYAEMLKEYLRFGVPSPR
jgi:hypothetical protein